MADSQYGVESKTVLFTEVLRKLQQSLLMLWMILLMLWMIPKAEDRSPVGPGV